MKNTQRILMTAVAGLTATQSIGVNVMPVLAAESNAEKEGYKQELSTKEQLEQKITTDRKSTRLNSSHVKRSRMPSSA